ncbi:hypothetical protein [Dysgonomonas sp.]
MNQLAELRTPVNGESYVELIERSGGKWSVRLIDTGIVLTVEENELIFVENERPSI